MARKLLRRVEEDGEDLCTSAKTTRNIGTRSIVVIDLHVSFLTIDSIVEMFGFLRPS
jgi:hypothetical protein